MTAWQHIIADDDSNGLIKALPVLIIFTIWALGALSKLAKRNDQNTGKAIPPPPGEFAAPKPMIPTSSAAGVGPRTPRLQKSNINRPARAPVGRPIARPGTLAVARTKAAFAQQQADFLRGMLAGRAIPSKTKRREPVLPKPKTVLAEVTPAPRDPPPIAQPKESPKVDARGLAKRMQPSLLRYQYILTEVLRPPVALRGEEDDY